MAQSLVLGRVGGRFRAAAVQLFPLDPRPVAQLIAYVLQPLATMWESVVAYLPNLFFLVTIAIFTWVAIRIVGLVFLEIERQTIRLSGFDPDWSPSRPKLSTFWSSSRQL